MIHAKKDTVDALYERALQLKVVDPHTHIQDDLLDFDQEMASKNLAGTQSSINRYPGYLVEAAVGQGRLVRRLMMDTTHGLAYSWFSQIVEGYRGRIDQIIETIGDNSEANRRKAGELLVGDLQDSRFSEYAEWIRVMFSLYLGDGSVDPLDPQAYDEVYKALKQRRNDPGFTARLLEEHNIAGYVTSIENRDKIPLDADVVRVKDVDLSYSTHPESYNMFDANYLVWPEGATDFGLFFEGHKYESEKFLLVLEEKLGTTLDSPKALERAIQEFLTELLWSPRTNPTSRVRYTDIVHPINFHLCPDYDLARVNTAMRYRKGSLRGDDLKHVVSFVTGAMLETLDDIGREIKDSGEEYGSCLQVCLGVTYFMDSSRELQSFPVYRPNMPQEAYATWLTYPNVHFEYIIANEQLYGDFANVAKQVSNVSVGPWWHFVRKHKIAEMLYDQLSMGPISSIASGITDARFVEMLVAKYQSVRRGVAMALAEMVDDRNSSLYAKLDEAADVSTLR